MKKIDFILKVTWLFVGILITISLIPSIYEQYYSKIEDKKVDDSNKFT